MPAATGLNNFVRITAGAVGTSVFTTLWDNRAALHHANLSEHVSLLNPSAVQALAGLERAGYSRAQALASINQMIDQQAFTMAATDLFYLSAVIFLALIVLVWFSAPAAVQESAAASGAH